MVEKMESKLWKGAKSIGIQTIIFFLLSVMCSFGHAGEKDSEEKFGFGRMWPARQQLWYFNKPRGVVIDRSGHVFVADTQNHCIKKFTIDGRFITRWGSFGSKEGEFNYVTALAVDQSGYLYAVDKANNRIQKFTADGRYLTQWGGKGFSAAPFGSPGGVAVDNKGFVYVTDTDNHCIHKFTSDGEFVLKWGMWGDDKGQFKHPGAIAIDHKGNLLVADLLNHRIQKFTDEGKFITAWGGYGSGDKQFNRPTGLALDSSGNIYVADSGSGRVKIFTPDGEFIGSWKKLKSKEVKGVTIGAWFISIGPGDMVYVADSAFSRIQKFTPKGRFIAEWASSGIGKGEFHRPADVALDHRGRLYVADTNNHRIQVIGPEGKSIFGWGGPGKGRGEFLLPRGIAVDAQGNVYVADSGNHRIQKFGPKGNYLTDWGRRGKEKGQFNFPEDVTVGAENIVYVADSKNHRIQMFDTHGKYLRHWGSKGSKEGQFNYPTGLEICSDGSVYVADAGNARIQRFSPKGKFLYTWGKRGTDEGQFNYPRKIAIDKKCNIYVADTRNFRVQKFTSEGRFLEKLGAKGSLPGKMNSPHALAVNAKGTRLYLADTDNDRIQLFQMAPVRSDTKSIVIAGGGSYAANHLWDATQLCANFAYLTLMNRGFSPEEIYYLSSASDLNLDDSQNGGVVDADATNHNLEQAITGWASDTRNLILYLVDHGGNGVFRTNAGQILAAADLDGWLDRLQSGTSGKITVIYDACESGSFLEALTPEKGEQRVVITSTSPGEIATFATQGTVSYSSFFWTHVFNGDDIKASHESALEAMALATAHQKALLDANGNAAGNETQDLALVHGKFIGHGAEQFGEGPTIGSFSPAQNINGTSTADLFAENVATQTGSVARVWAIIRPPNFQQGSSNNALLELPAIDLLPVGNDRYEAGYNGFHIEGDYRIFILARDSFGNTSEPYKTRVTVGNPMRRRAIVVAGGPTSDPLWPTVEKLTSMVYEFLKFRGYDDDDISLLTPVTNSATLSKLNDAITSVAAGNTRDVVLYLVGSGDVEAFQLNAAEKLTATVLDNMLDDLQGSLPGEVVVIYDGSLSGSFLSKLTPAAGRPRIMISSTDSNQSANFISDGDISFSSFFWRQVLNGANVRDAFVHAINAIDYAAGGQTPMLDDSGNGIGNELGIDGLVARNYIIGSDFGLAGNAPIIETVSPDQTLTGGRVSATIRAENVTTTNVIERVWAVITPPGFDGRQSDGHQLDSIDLAAVGGGNYEAVYDKFNLFGIYHIAVFAKDANGSLAMLRTTTVEHSEGPDSYEVDDSFAQATKILLNSGVPQRHNFHLDDDQDWVKFDGIKDQVVEIKVSRVGGDADVVLEGYDTDGTTRVWGPWSWGGTGEGEFKEWVPSENGTFYVKTMQPEGHFPGEDTGYDLEINRPIGVLLVVNVIDLFTDKPISGAEITTTLPLSGNTGTGGNFTTGHPAGTWVVTAKKGGYMHGETTVVLPPIGSMTVDFTLRPIRIQGGLLLLLLP